jgi:hypothetical protein
MNAKEKQKPSGNASKERRKTTELPSVSAAAARVETL